MSSYIGLHAGLYDTFYAEKDYAGEAGFVDNLIAKFGRGSDILELACGTGTHAFHLEKLGYHVSGLDYSKDMIREAQLKKANRNSSNDFRVGNMMDIPFEDGSFDNVICLFDSIGYVQTNENISKVFSEVRRVLNKDGVFIFEFWHAAAMIAGFDARREKHFKRGNTKITRISETDIDVFRQVCEVHYTIHIEEAGQTQTIGERMVNRYFLCQEMQQFLTVNGFGKIHFHNGFRDDQQINADTWHVVCSALKI